MKGWHCRGKDGFLPYVSTFLQALLRDLQIQWPLPLSSRVRFEHSRSFFRQGQKERAKHFGSDNGSGRQLCQSQRGCYLHTQLSGHCLALYETAVQLIYFPLLFSQVIHLRQQRPLAFQPRIPANWSQLSITSPHQFALQWKTMDVYQPFLIWESGDWRGSWMKDVIVFSKHLIHGKASHLSAMFNLGLMFNRKIKNQ
jgi:hypothetical protein